MPNLLANKLPELNVVVFWVCMAVCVSVFLVLIYSLVKHHKSSGHEAAAFHSSLKVDILWAVIPFLIVVALAAKSLFSYALF